MMNTSQAILSTCDSTPEPSVGKTLGAAGPLLGVATIGFFKGCLLSGLLNLIPILPAYKRSTGSIMNRTFALFIFGPVAAFIVVAFPLLSVPGYRRAATSLCERTCAWYGKKDLEFGV
jgi:hypothetical protein